MIKQRNMKELVEELRGHAKKNYVSDLYDQIAEPAVRKALKQVEPKDYSVEEWQSVIEYVTNGKCNCSSMEDVKRFLDEL